MVVTPVKLKARPPATDDKAMLAPLDVVSVKRTSRTEELGIVGTEGVVIDIRRHGSDPLYAVVVRGRELPALLGTNDLAATGERAHVVEEPRALPVRKPRDDIRWEVYEIFDPEVDRPLADVSRAEARAHHHRLLAMTGHRISELRKLADSAGIELDGSEGSLQAFNDWFAANVEPDPERPDQARGRWLSVAQDLALYLGDLMMERHPHLHWKLLEGGKRNISYQRTVLVGYRKAHPRYNTDLDYGLGQYANALARGERDQHDFFVAMLRWTDEYA